MTTVDQVKNRLDEVITPHVVRSLTSMNLIRDTTITDGAVKVTLASIALDEYSQNWITEKIKESLQGPPDIKNMEVVYNYPISQISKTQCW